MDPARRRALAAHYTPERLARAYEVRDASEPGLSIADWFEHHLATMDAALATYLRGG